MWFYFICIYIFIWWWTSFHALSWVTHLTGMISVLHSRLLSALQWRHNCSDGVLNHQPHDCFPNRYIQRRSKKISKLRVTGICAGNSPVTGEVPVQMDSNAENVSIWWRHHIFILQQLCMKLLTRIYVFIVVLAFIVLCQKWRNKDVQLINQTILCL